MSKRPKYIFVVLTVFISVLLLYSCGNKDSSDDDSSGTLSVVESTVESSADMSESSEEVSAESSEEVSAESSEEVSAESSEEVSVESSEEVSVESSEEVSAESSEEVSVESSEEVSAESSEEVSVESSEEVSAESSEEVSVESSEEVSAESSEEVSVESSEEVSTESSEEVSAESSEEVSAESSEEVSVESSEEVSVESSEEVSVESSEEVSVESSEEVSAELSEEVSTESSEDISDVSNDLFDEYAEKESIKALASIMENHKESLHVSLRSEIYYLNIPFAVEIEIYEDYANKKSFYSNSIKGAGSVLQSEKGFTENGVTYKINDLKKTYCEISSSVGLNIEALISGIKGVETKEETIEKETYVVDWFTHKNGSSLGLYTKDGELIYISTLQKVQSAVKQLLYRITVSDDISDADFSVPDGYKLVDWKAF